MRKPAPHLQGAAEGESGLEAAVAERMLVVAEEETVEAEAPRRPNCRRSKLISTAFRNALSPFQYQRGLTVSLLVDRQVCSLPQRGSSCASICMSEMLARCLWDSVVRSLLPLIAASWPITRAERLALRTFTPDHRLRLVKARWTPPTLRRSSIRGPSGSRYSGNLGDMSATTFTIRTSWV